MEEVLLLLRRLEQEAKKQFGKHWRVWHEPYPFPGGCITKNPKLRTDYIVTVYFLHSVIAEKIDSAEDIEARLREIEDKRGELSRQLTQLNRKSEQLLRMKYFLVSIKE